MKAVLVLLVGTLAACQSWQARSPDHAQPPPQRGAMGSGTASGTGQDMHEMHGMGGMHGMGKDNWYGMCEMHKRIMSGATPEAQQARAGKAMPNMSQESRQRHLQMMQERCR